MINFAFFVNCWYYSTSIHLTGKFSRSLNAFYFLTFVSFVINLKEIKRWDHNRRHNNTIFLDFFLLVLKSFFFVFKPFLLSISLVKRNYQQFILSLACLHLFRHKILFFFHCLHFVLKHLYLIKVLLFLFQ